MRIGLPVLLYHNVGPRGSMSNPITAPLEQFEEQISWLERNRYVGIRGSDWIAWRRNRKSLPNKPVLITFDDGYEGVASNALPVLEHHGFSATLFLVTRRIGDSNRWDQPGYLPEPIMSSHAITYWASRGFEFGCHTRTHADLTTLERAQLRNEIEGSRDDLATILGSVPAMFAYPWGKFNQPVREHVRAAFELAFSVRRGLNFTKTDPHLMRRTTIHPGLSMLDFKSRVILGFSPVAGFKRLRPSLQGLRQPRLVP
jgi:peptidoglycan/xylan/chitin deacetylase (PgdA/CDA1 family)